MYLSMWHTIEVCLPTCSVSKSPNLCNVCVGLSLEYVTISYFTMVTMLATELFLVSCIRYTQQPTLSNEDKLNNMCAYIADR